MEGTREEREREDRGREERGGEGRRGRGERWDNILKAVQGTTYSEAKDRMYCREVSCQGRCLTSCGTSFVYLLCLGCLWP